MKATEFLKKAEGLSSSSSRGASRSGRSSRLTPWQRFALKAIGKGKRVLDLGCGDGAFSKVIQNRNNEVLGVEINERAASQAKDLGVAVKVADLNDPFPFPDASFDCIHAGNIVEYVYDTKQFFMECRRVLRPRGMMVFSTLNLNSLQNRVRVATGGYLEQYGAYPEDHFGSHIRVFNYTKIRELCEIADLEIVEFEGVSHGPKLARNTGRLKRGLHATVSLVEWLYPKFSSSYFFKVRVKPDHRSV